MSTPDINPDDENDESDTCESEMESDNDDELHLSYTILNP